MAVTVGADVKLDIKLPCGNRLWVKGSLGLKRGIMLDGLRRLTPLDVLTIGRTWGWPCSFTGTDLRPDLRFLLFADIEKPPRRIRPPGCEVLKVLSSPWPKGSGFGRAPFLRLWLVSKHNLGPFLVTRRLLRAPDKTLHWSIPIADFIRMRECLTIPSSLVSGLGVGLPDLAVPLFNLNRLDRLDGSIWMKSSTWKGSARTEPPRERHFATNAPYQRNPIQRQKG